MEQERMIRLINLSDGKEMLELLALQTAAYIKEAEMIGLTDIPPLFESPDSVRGSGEMYYGLYEEGSLLIGAVSLKKDDSVWASSPALASLRICRLMVHPQRLRQGIASGLLDCVLRMASEEKLDVCVLAVSTHTAAVSLYSRFGFRTVRRHPAANGLVLNEMLCPRSTS
jgi:ribosomal protein S18 acetylase RimI-like enzyme